MHYFLKQVLPPNSDPEPPIEIHLYTDSVYVGRQQLKSLTRFPQISRNHAVFYKSDDGNIFVKDLNSLNGIYVNDTRIGSSLKQLNSGDVIGFGVASSGAAEGFVCVLCTEEVDVEELEITDDEEVKITDDESSKKSNSKPSVKRESGPNTTQVASHSNNNNVYLPDIYEPPSVSKHQNRTKNSQRKVERGESNYHAREGFTCYDNSNLNPPESSGIRSSLPHNDVQGEPACKGEAKYPGPVKRESDPNTTQVASHNNNNNVYLPDIYELPSVSKHQNRTKNSQRKVERGESNSHARERVTCYDNSNSNPPESSGIRSSQPHNDVQGEPACKGKTKYPAHLSLRECFIHLVRCDDSSFQFPSDVKNPFKTEQIKLPSQRTKLTKQRGYSENIKHISHRKRRRSRILNADSSDDSDEYIPDNAPTGYSDVSDENIRVSAQSKAQPTRYSVNNKHRRRRSRKLSTDFSDDSAEYKRQISRSKAQHTTYSFNNKHRRKKSKKLSTDSSNDSDEYIRQSVPTKARYTTYPVNNEHQRKQSRKLSADSSDDSEYIRQHTRSKAGRSTNLLSNKHLRKRPKQLSSDSSGDSDKNADLVSNKHERKRPRNSSSVSSDGSGKIIYARTSSKTRLKADALPRDKNGHDGRTNSAKQVSGRKGTLPPGPDLEELKCKRSSSKTKGNLKAEAKISFVNQDDGAGVRYSQADTFYITDDETYLDLKSSQDCAIVKQETKDSGDSNSESDTCREIFGRENHYSPTPNTAVREGHSDDRTESIEAIRAFIQGSKNSKSDSRSAPRDRVVQINRSIFPLPSRDTDGEQSPEYHSDASIRSNDEARGDASGEVRNSASGERSSLLNEHNKGIRKSAGRTLLTEPKPLTHIARKFRGRDENFVEKKKSPTVPPKAEKPSGDETSRSKSKNSKLDDCTPKPSAKKRISHFANKASTSKSNGPNLAPNELSPPSKPSLLVDVVEKNRVDIERAESSRGHATTRPPPAENAATRPPRVKNTANDHQRPTVTAAVGDHQIFSARLEGSNGVLRQLLQMNTRWLQEQVANREPPPDVSRGAAPLPSSFDSHESYVAMFRPLIILEIWERLFVEWREVETDVGRNCKFHFAVLGHTERGGCVELMCESVSADGRPGPRVGDVAVLEVKEGPPQNQCTSLFGYILGHSVEPLGSDYVLGDTPWKQLPEDWRSGGDVPKRWIFRACIKRKRETPSFDQHSLMRGYNLGCVRNLLCWADAFCSIRDSPLLDTLLQPATYTLPTSKSQPPFDQQNLFYTCEQEVFIRRVCDTFLRKATDPEVFLLSGGPGTGKTHVIVGLIERLLYRRGAGDIRVVVAAPGDTAVDEIGRRLIRLSRRYEGNAVRFVRLGHERLVDRQMLPYCVTKVLRGVSVDEAEVLRRSHVVLSTLSGLCAAHQLRPSLCIVDDASQCTEPDALQAVATGAALLVLAGDPCQRAPRVLSRMARHCGLGGSLFQRMMQSRPAHALSDQFRMHPDIARFPCPSSFPSPRRPLDSNHLRPYLVLDLLDDEDPVPVAVVCEFLCTVDSRAAVAALVAPSSRRARFRADASPLLRRHARRVEVRSPDGFLGREKDVVVLWAALACPMRLRAALTRARRCLIVCVAGQKVMRSNPLWANLLSDAEERGVLCSVPPSTDHLKRMLCRRLLVQPSSCR